MAFTVEDVRDLVHLLAEHPEWRAELRPLILGDEMLGVPAMQRSTDERLEISRTRDTRDLDRARARADILERVGYRTRPVVGGKIAPERVRELAGERDILIRLADQAN